MIPNKIKFSIILPVYNVENYLKECIDSCENQDLPKDEYEIIAINDGSTDSSLGILQDLSLNYKNIKIVSQSNKGLSEARNRGLRESKGEYVWFIDSDDFIKNNILNTVYCFLSDNDLDAIHIGYQMVDIQKEKKYKPSIDYFNKITDGLFFLTSILKEQFYAWSFIFKRNCLLQNEFKFTPGIIYEDIDSIPILMLKFKRVASVNETMYYYRQRHNSIVHSVNYKMIDDLFNICLKYKKLYLQAGTTYIEKKIYNELVTSFLISFFILLSKIKDVSDERDKRAKTAFLEFPKLLFSKRLSTLKKIAVLTYNISPYLLFCLLRIKYN